MFCGIIVYLCMCVHKCQCTCVYLCWAEIFIGQSQKSLRTIDREWDGEVADWKMCLDSHSSELCGPSSFALFLRLGGQAVLRPRVCLSAGVSLAAHWEELGENHPRMQHARWCQSWGYPWLYRCPPALKGLERLTRLSGAYSASALDVVVMEAFGFIYSLFCQDLHVQPVTLRWKLGCRKI